MKLKTEENLWLQDIRKAEYIRDCKDHRGLLLILYVFYGSFIMAPFHTGMDTVHERLDHRYVGKKGAAVQKSVP